MSDDQQFFWPEQISQEDWENTPESVKRLVESLAENTSSAEREGRSQELVQQILNHAQQEESRYRQVLQAQTDLILRSLPDTTITFANDALCRALGQSLDEVMGQQWSHFVPPEDLETLHRKIAALTPAQPTFENINRDHRANNQIGWTQWISLGIFDEQGNLVELQSAGRDITELQQKILREQALNRVFQAIRNSLDLEVIFATATAETAQLLAPLNCFVVQYLPNEGVWRHVAEFLHDSATPSYLGLDIPDQGNPFATQLKQLQTVRVQDTEILTDAINQQIAQRVPGAWLLIPLVVEGVLWGSFTLIAHQHSFIWLEEQVALAQMVAHQLEVAIQQANLYQQGQLELAERQRIAAALSESEARYRLLAENMNDLVCLHTIDGQYLYVSPSCEALLGYRYNKMLGLDPYTFIHPEDRDRVYQETFAVAREEKTTPITYRMRQKSGNYIWFETLIKLIVDEIGQITQLQTTSRDVTERVQAQNQLKHDALHDALTGLPNRHLLMERLELALNRTRRLKNYQFAVIFLDLDRFKVINDSLGHLAGDQLLVEIAQKLKSILRDIDLATRLGGDEFIILLEEVTDIQDAVRVVERIFAALQMPLTIEEREVYTTASVGIVIGSRSYQQASHLLRDADIAMYRAKLMGKARYEIFNTEMHIQALNRLHLENDLRRAIKDREFVLYYQPIIALKNLQLVGFEALIRWQHPTQGLKSPAEFIAIAEEINIITTLDFEVLEAACHQLVTWQMAFPDLSFLKVSVNLSAQDLRHPTLLEEINRVLLDTQLAGADLTLEITESMLIENIESTIQLLRQLKSWDIQISIDDFGTGYSSLNYLHRLPIDYLKVDRSFVSQIQTDPRNRQIVETLSTLSQQLGLMAIAEGIETQAQLERLQQLGYQYGQGYFFSHPLPQAAATEFLSNYRQGDR